MADQKNDIAFIIDTLKKRLKDATVKANYGIDRMAGLTDEEISRQNEGRKYQIFDSPEIPLPDIQGLISGYIKSTQPVSDFLTHQAQNWGILKEEAFPSTPKYVEPPRVFDPSGLKPAYPTPPPFNPQPPAITPPPQPVSAPISPPKSAQDLILLRKKGLR